MNAAAPQSIWKLFETFCLLYLNTCMSILYLNTWKSWCIWKAFIHFDLSICCNTQHYPRCMEVVKTHDWLRSQNSIRRYSNEVPIIMSTVHSSVMIIRSCLRGFEAFDFLSHCSGSCGSAVVAISSKRVDVRRSVKAGVTVMFWRFLHQRSSVPSLSAK